MRSAVVNRPPRPPLLALAVAAVALAAWLGAPLFLSPAADPIAKLPPPPAGSAEHGPAVTPPAPPTAAPRGSARPSARPSGSGSPAVIPDPSPIPSGAWIPPVPKYRARATATLRAALDARLEQLRSNAGIPGISVSIAFADGSSWQGTAGLADVASGRHVTADTVFPVASVSKTFTAALILALAADGRLGLDVPVVLYLPTLPIDRRITARELLEHRSGLRDFYFGPGVDRALLSKPGLIWTPARSFKYVGKPFGAPGISWHYSNTNYLVLGMLAEAVGRATVAAQLHERFLTRLGLDHTSYQAVEAPLGPLTHTYRFTGASPSSPAINLSDGTSVAPFTSVVTAAGAAGAIATTPSDLTRWVRALYQGTALDQASRSAMVGDALPTSAYRPTVAYGLGVQVVPIGHHVTLGHSGRFLGAWAAVRWLPDEQVAIAVLTNQSRSDPNLIVADLLRLAFLPSADCANCPPLP